MATFFRAAIMLAVLVGLPTAWICCGPLPERAQRSVDRVIAAVKEAIGENGESLFQTAGPAQPPSVQLPSDDTAPAWTGPAAAPQSTQPAIAVAPPSPTPSVASTLEPLLERLRQMGVVQYALERWGSAGELYRFHCEMPLAGARITQQFEAIAAEPRASIEQVLAELDSWRLARGQPSVLR